MTDTELAAMVKAVGTVMREYTAVAMHGMADRIAALEAMEVFRGQHQERLCALEQRALIPGPPGPRGDDGGAGPQGQVGEPGKDAEVPDVDTLVLRAVELIPKPVNGRDGIDGKDADIAAIKAELVTLVATHTLSRDEIAGVVVSAVTEAVSKIASPRDGSDGRDGKDADPDFVRAEVVKAVAAIPPPKDGKDASPDDVAEMVEDMVAKAVAAIPVPKDGVGLTGALIDRSGHLILTLSDGTTKDVGMAAGRDVDMTEVVKIITNELAQWPRPKDGKDGLGFDQLEFEHDEEGRLYLKFQRGDIVKRVRVPGQVMRGAWSGGELYLKGDGVIRNGLWHALVDHPKGMPGDGSPDWVLAIKRPADGKAGKDGLDGKAGRDGRDLTTVRGPDGRPWVP